MFHVNPTITVNLRFASSNEKVGKQSQNTQRKCGLKDSKYSSFSKHLSVKGLKQGLDCPERCSDCQNFDKSNSHS